MAPEPNLAPLHFTLCNYRNSFSRAEQLNLHFNREADSRDRHTVIHSVPVYEYSHALLNAHPNIRVFDIP